MNLEFHYPPKFEGMAEEFDNAYEFIQLITPPESQMVLSSSKTARACRFCNRKYPVVTFSDNAHVFPELLGNKYWISDFECDECNHFFGNKMETHLANFLGISRTINGINGKKGVPTFESIGEGIIAQAEKIFNRFDGITIEGKNNSTGHFRKSEDGKNIKVSYKKGGYIPLYVYKAFIKIGLSILPEVEIPYYRNALQFLLTRNPKDFLLSFCPLQMHLMSLGYGSDVPFILLFKKRDKKSQYPTHYFNLNFKNYSFSIHMPLHLEDMHMYNSQTPVRLPYLPPLFTKPFEDNPIEFISKRLDLSSSEKLKGETEELVVQFVGDSQNRIAIDLKTGKEILNPKESAIKKIIISLDDDASFPLD